MGRKRVRKTISTASHAGHDKNIRTDNTRTKNRSNRKQNKNKRRFHVSDTAPPSPNTSKPVLVMGANGFMGSHVTRQLLSAGRRVRVMVRKASDTRALEGLNVETHYGDITDRSSVLDAMRGCASVFYNVVDTRAWLVDPRPSKRFSVRRSTQSWGGSYSPAQWSPWRAMQARPR